MPLARSLARLLFLFDLLSCAFSQTNPSNGLIYIHQMCKDTQIGIWMVNASGLGPQTSREYGITQTFVDNWVGSSNLTLAFARDDGVFNLEIAQSANQLEMVHFNMSGPDRNSHVNYSLDRTRGVPHYSDNTFTEIKVANGAYDPLGPCGNCTAVRMSRNETGWGALETCLQSCDYHITLCADSSTSTSNSSIPQPS